MDISALLGKIFTAKSGEVFGPLRKIAGKLPKELIVNTVVQPIAEDSCGNYFALKGGEVLFWDHELSKFIHLAPSTEEFSLGCSEASEILLEKNQVESVWVDPEFAKEFGLNEKS